MIYSSVHMSETTIKIWDLEINKIYTDIQMFETTFLELNNNLQLCPIIWDQIENLGFFHGNL